MPDESTNWAVLGGLTVGERHTVFDFEEDATKNVIKLDSAFGKLSYYQDCERFELVQDDEPEDEGYFGLVDAVIEFRKNNPEPEYVSPEIKERNRIIAIIESEKYRMAPYKSNSGRIAALDNLLTLINNPS